MKKNIIALLTSLAVVAMVTIAYAASSASCSLNYVGYRGTGTLNRDIYTGRVTGTTTTTNGNGVYLMLRVTDRVAGEVEFPFTLSLTSSYSRYHDPVYAIEDNIGATSMHAIHAAVSSMPLDATTISIP